MPSQPLFWVLALMALFAVGGTAFTAPGPAGDDVGPAISGFTISNVVFHPDRTNPTFVDRVTFVAQSSATSGWPATLNTRIARFTTVDSAWYSCSDDAGGATAGTYVITCATSGTGFFYDGVTRETRLTVRAVAKFDTVIAQ